MTPNFKRELEITEMARGISGILDDIAAYCGDCADGAKACNDTGSIETYNRSAVRISKLALKIKQEDE